MPPTSSPAAGAGRRLRGAAVRPWRWGPGAAAVRRRRRSALRWRSQSPAQLPGLSQALPAPPQLASEEVNQLVLKLPQASNAAEVFSTFAEHVQQLFLGLMHIR